MSLCCMARRWHLRASSTDRRLLPPGTNGRERGNSPNSALTVGMDLSLFSSPSACLWDKMVICGMDCPFGTVSRRGSVRQIVWLGSV